MHSSRDEYIASLVERVAETARVEFPSLTLKRVNVRKVADKCLRAWVSERLWMQIADNAAEQAGLADRLHTFVRKERLTEWVL